MQAPLFGVAVENNVETRLVNGYFAVFQARYFLCIDVDTDNIVARFGKTGAGY